MKKKTPLKSKGKIQILSNLKRKAMERLKEKKQENISSPSELDIRKLCHDL